VLVAQQTLALVTNPPPPFKSLIYISWEVSLGEIGCWTGVQSCTNLNAPVWVLEREWAIGGVNNVITLTNDCPAKFYRVFISENEL
jgi:hypothetical protein